MLKHIKIHESVNTCRVPNFYGAFSLCKNLQNLNITNMQTDRSASFVMTFSSANNIQSLDLSK